jgi:capsular polysaccharide biosynthesis protein
MNMTSTDPETTHMNLKQTLQVAKRWWWLGAIPIIVVGLYVAVTFTPPSGTYQVVLRFTTGSRPTETLSQDYDRYYAWLASEYIANGLADLAQTSDFSEAVAERLAGEGLDLAPQAVQNALVTDNVQSIMVVYLTWPDPVQAVTIAEAIGQELLEAGPAYYPQMDQIGSVARLADTPVAAPLSPSLRAQILGPALRLVIAAAAGLALIILVHYVDPWIREEDELTATGLPVLAVIPRHRRNRV